MSDMPEAAADLAACEALLVLIRASSGASESVFGDVLASIAGGATESEAARLAGITTPGARGHMKRLACNRIWDEAKRPAILRGWFAWLRGDDKKPVVHVCVCRECGAVMKKHALP